MTLVLSKRLSEISEVYFTSKWVICLLKGGNKFVNAVKKVSQNSSLVIIAQSVLKNEFGDPPYYLRGFGSELALVI